MTWQTPWAISGVTEVPLSVARVLAYAATGGNEGVVGSTDLTVRALSVPGTSVIVGGGAFACLNRFGSSSNESYVGQNIGDDTIAVTATGGAQRYDLVYAAITDPGQPGNPATPAPVTTKIIQGVASTVTKLQDVPGYTTTSGYALALLTIPASTATITQAMITDLRALVLPRSQRQTYVKIPAADTTLTATTFTQWPALSQTVKIPTWATVARVVIYLNSISYGSQVYGQLRARLGTQVGSSVIYDGTAPSAGDLNRENFMVTGEFAISPALRGTSVVVSAEGLKGAVAGSLKAQLSGSNMFIDIQFDQTASSS